MDSSSVIILGIAILILVSIVVFSIEIYLPLHMRVEMYANIRPYMFQLEAEGLLTSLELSSLTQDLVDIGLENVSIGLEYTGQGFGDWIEVVISGDYRRKAMVELFSRKSEEIRMAYKKKIYIRHIEN